MTLASLKIYCAVVEEGSFRRAAARVHRSQPAVSQQVKALEHEFGHTLLDRRTCRPTSVGKVLYKRARHVLDRAHALRQEIEDIDAVIGRELRVGTSDTTALYFLPPYLREFAKALPGTHVAIVNRPSQAVADLVLRDELDVGIVTLPVGHEDLEERQLFQERLVLVLRRDHPLASRRRVGLATLRQEPLLLLDPDTHTGKLLRDCFRAQSFDPNVVLDSGSFEVIKRYVAEGVGLSFLPEIAIAKADRALITVEAPVLPKVEIGVIRRRAAYQSRAERLFLDLIFRRNSR